MRFLLEAPPAAGLEGLRKAAGAAKGAGADGLVLAGHPAMPAPLAAAAALAAVEPDLLIAAEVPLGDRHPLEVAEEAVVVDLAARGRLIVIARPARGAEDAFGEAVDLLRAAWTAAPFASPGPRWPVPARRPGAASSTRVTPAPFGPELALWLAGVPAMMAVERGLGHLAGHGCEDAELRAAWSGGPARPRGRDEAAEDAEGLVLRLRGGQRAFGQDWAVLRGPFAAAVAAAAHARPRLQLGALPPGLAEHWAAVSSKQLLD